MEYKLPHTIENVIGEKLVFKSITDDDKLLVENFVQPGAGPVMHVHYKQDESLTVKEGKLGYQIQGEEPKYAGPGETVVFERGVPHRFWNAGEEVLRCEGWIQPANSIVFFLSTLYEAMNKAGGEQPEAFDSAYLMTRYKSEYGLVELPAFVRKAIIPATYFIGKLTGKYRKFKNAPQPL